MGASTALSLSDQSVENIRAIISDSVFVDLSSFLSYNVATIGILTEEAIKKYIAEQSEESRKEDSEGVAF